MSIQASMAGTVLSVLVSVGDQVTAGQEVVMIESMKMEIPMESTSTGKVAEVHVQPGDFVNEGDTLVSFE